MSIEWLLQEGEDGREAALLPASEGLSVMTASCSCGWRLLSYLLAYQIENIAIWDFRLEIAYLRPPPPDSSRRELSGRARSPPTAAAGQRDTTHAAHTL